MPRFDPVTWDSVLGTSLADVEAQAENRVRVHVETHLSEGAEAWIADGVAYLGQETCPFCAADTSSNDLVRAYRSLFSRAYEDLKTEVTTLARAASTALSEAAFDLVRRATQTNAAVAPTWAAHSTECPPAPDLEVAEKMRGVLERAYAAAFAEKSGGILEPVGVTSQAAAAWSEIAALQKELDEYNSAIDQANLQIAAVKSTAASTTLTAALDLLKKLRNQRARYQPVALQAVDGLEKARKQKKALEAGKRKAKETLDTATDALFRSYQDAINEHLSNCGCGYAITGTKTVYPGGKPRTDYQLVINNQPVELGASKAGGAPSFKNTLSDGDKSTLAFAFFLAKLQLDPTLAAKIVVLDDPMTSLDAHRRSYTCQQIVKLVTRCRQLILMTHDALFARQVWDDLPKQKKALQISDQNNRSALIDWDILRATQSDYFARYERIQEFVVSGEGDPFAVALSLRLLLEGNLRMRFPGQFPGGEWLGDFIKRVKNAGIGDPLYPMQATLAELTAINDYAKQFHHDQNPAAATVKPVEAELKAYGKRVLAFSAGSP